MCTCMGAYAYMHTNFASSHMHSYTILAQSNEEEEEENALIETRWLDST